MEMAGPIGVAGIRRERTGAWLQVTAPRGFAWTEVTIPIRRLPAGLDGVRMVVLGDTHLTPRWHGVYEELLAKIAEADADLILFTGDLVDNKRDPRPGLATARRLVEGLRSRLGTYATLGNHDGHLLAPHLVDWGVNVIDTGRTVVPINGETIELIGLPGVDRAELTADFLRSMPSRRGGVPRIVLSHYPDHIERTRCLRADVKVSGHTHGGQICLPGGFPILKHDDLPRRLISGVHWLDPTWLIVTRGMGFTELPVRMFCPAETMVVKLK